MRAVELAIDITATSAAGGFDQTARSAAAMADDVAAASREAEGALSRIGDSADNLDDKAGRATGALGALSSGFELVGAEKYAGALQAAALATDFASGAGQALTLVMELESVARARAVVTATAHKVATTAATAASKAAAAAQWALNAAMRANPLGLVITALTLVAAGFALAWNRSERFRTVVTGVMEGARAAIGWPLEAVRNLTGWVRDKLTPVWEPMRKAGVKAFELLMTPINLIKDAIQWLMDKIPTIKFPKPPEWMVKAGGAVAGVFGDAPAAPPYDPGTSGGGPAAAGGVTLNVTVNVPAGFVGDEPTLARVIQTVLRNQVERLSTVPGGAVTVGGF